MLSKKKKERWEERQKKIEEQAKEIDDAMEVEVILAKEDVNKAVVQAWNSSEKLIPYVRTLFNSTPFRIRVLDRPFNLRASKMTAFFF